MSANLFEVKTNEKLESHGVWCKWLDTDTEFLIASAKNHGYIAALTKEVRKRGISNYGHPNETSKGQEESLELKIIALAKAVLLDWRGDVILEKDAPPERYSYNAAVKALHIRPFREWVEIQSTREELFQDSENAADEAALKSGVAMEPEVPPKPSVP